MKIASPSQSEHHLGHRNSKQTLFWRYFQSCNTFVRFCGLFYTVCMKFWDFCFTAGAASSWGCWEPLETLIRLQMLYKALSTVSARQAVYLDVFMFLLSTSTKTWFQILQQNDQTAHLVKCLQSWIAYYNKSLKVLRNSYFLLSLAQLILNGCLYNFLLQIYLLTSLYR